MAPALRTRSGDAAFLRVLRAGMFAGRVHSVFPRVINVEAPDGTLRTLASRGFDDAPETLVVDVAAFVRSGIETGDAVAVRRGQLVIGAKLAIDFATASPWEAVLPPYPADDARLRESIAVVRTALLHVAGGWDDVPFATGSPALAAGTAALLARHTAALRFALAHDDFDAACSHGRSILGLGHGLTPSGDDLLVGLFAVLHLPGSPAERFKAIGAAIVANARRRTTAISVAALRAAALGRVRESIASLLDAMLHGRPAGVMPELRRVLAIGSTSGADIVAGILTGFEIHLHDRDRVASLATQHVRGSAGFSVVTSGALG